MNGFSEAVGQKPYCSIFKKKGMDTEVVETICIYIERRNSEAYGNSSVTDGRGMRSVRALKCFVMKILNIHKRINSTMNPLYTSYIATISRFGCTYLIFVVFRNLLKQIPVILMVYTSVFIFKEKDGTFLYNLMS